MGKSNLPPVLGQNVNNKKPETVFIFVPNSLPKNGIGTLNGFVETTADSISFYVTNDNFSYKTHGIIGYCSCNTPTVNVLRNGNKKWIHINNTTGKVSAYGFEESSNNNINVICYDYEVFKNADLATFRFQNYNEHFQALVETIQDEKIRSDEKSTSFVLNILQLILMFVDIFLIFYDKIKSVGDYSATAKLLKKNAVTFKWVQMKIKCERKVSLSVGNVIVSKIVDFLLGFMLLYFIVQYEAEFIEFVQNMTESIIHGLENLLHFLMGSPVGLKLNYAFNKTLGTFFLYHIALWRAFLQAASPLLTLGLHLLVIPGAFGLSYQAALLSDMVAFSTFHVYCIYVYAARLYAVQIRSLVSLWRLFIGHKYNPLRERVDSHQYTHHQLFIGTLGFTVLLFLLPTTFLYYGVFTVFRVALIGLDGVLMRMVYILQCLPFYVGTLWAINSFSVRGAIKLSIGKPNCSNLCEGIHATMQTLPFWKCIVSSIPHGSANELPIISWGLLCTNVVNGLLL